MSNESFSHGGGDFEGGARRRRPVDAPMGMGDEAGKDAGPRTNPKLKGCRFMNEDGKCEVDYKNVRLLQKLVTPQGKIYSRKRSGACAQCQKQIKIAIKRARFMALISVVGR